MQAIKKSAVGQIWPTGQSLQTDALWHKHYMEVFFL